MSNLRFDTSVYQNRVEKAQRLCRENNIAGLVVPTGPQLAYLTGSWISTHERFTALIIPASGTPAFVLPGVDRGDLDRSAIPDMDVEIIEWNDGQDAHNLAVSHLTAPEGSTIAVGADMTADHLLTLQSILRGVKTVLANDILAELFISKDVDEIEQLRLAGAAIDRVHATVPSLLLPGRTERDVASDLEKLILEEHSSVDFIIVGSAENGANAHHDYSDRVLANGDVVVVDIGGTYGPGYHSDCTRTYVVGGTVNPQVKEKFDVLLAAQEAAVQAVKPGVPAAEIDRVARDILSDAGLGEFFIHRTGHGIGLSTHEEPFIMAGNDLLLAPGMAFSIEPGFYIDGEFGARIEDIVVVTEHGCERLNNEPRELR